MAVVMANPTWWFQILSNATIIVAFLYLAVALSFSLLLQKREPGTFKKLGSPRLFGGPEGGLMNMVNHPGRSTPPLSPEDWLLKWLLAAAQILLYLVGVLILVVMFFGALSAA